jgi:hypothetical protein
MAIDFIQKGKASLHGAFSCERPKTQFGIVLRQSDGCKFVHQLING